MQIELSEKEAQFIKFCTERVSVQGADLIKAVALLVDKLKDVKMPEIQPPTKA